MSFDPVAEHERVRRQYAPMRARDVVIYVAGPVLLGVASLFREVDWFFYAGMVTGIIAWELTKIRLRRNAQRFAEASQRP